MRSQQQWLSVFVERSRALEAELKVVVASQTPGYPNVDIAHSNVSKWHELAVSANL